MKSSEIRNQFLAYFKSKQHKIVPSAPIVLKDDPTLMFTNSGMNQFKDYFLGYKVPTSPRIADTQKCLRVSGKHNDLDDVGKDTYHHTMFEMLGNWSFNDYFKKEAIDWAWELLTEKFKIPKENLYVTVFEGDKEDGLEKDQEAFEFWKQHIAEDRILNGNKKDNFWEMGDTGPCGPASEIHVDIRSPEEKKKIDGKSLVNQDHPQVIEIWNLVFMEYQRKADGSLEKLASKNVDTGMGFERLCMVLQGKKSNYDTDVFMPLITKVEEITGKKYGVNEETDVAIRVVVDHVRAVAFAIADGQIPSNTGAGYVIRRILRRAISYGYRFLDMRTPFIYELVPVLKEQMQDAFPEIAKQEKLVTQVIEEEEKSFLNTLEQGLVRLENVMQEQKEEKVLKGSSVFELYDTYGFPKDLTGIIAQEKGYTIDEEGYETELQKQKERSKKDSASKTYDWEIIKQGEAEDFVGYDVTQKEVEITRVRRVENKQGEFYQIVLDTTPFYAESGGQVGDTGWLISPDQTLKVLDTKKENNLIIHVTQEKPIATQYEAVVDDKRRKSIMRNHSATHLLHQALRVYLGEQVEQKGSFVGPDYLRFDFSHFSKMTEDQIQKVNDFVNEKIQEEIPLVELRNVPYKDAIDSGAVALFGEKYGDEVRTINFGDSTELCGGTHVPNTRDIFLFQIVSEGSSAAGIRRIEAVTGQKALDYFKNFKQKYDEVVQQLGTANDPVKSIEKLQSENKQLSDSVEALQRKEALNQKEVWKNSMQNINGVNAILQKTSMDNGAIKDIIFQLKSEIPNSFIVIANDYNDKPTISVGISNDLVESKNWNAGNLVREWAKEIKGGGGGQAVFATAGGKDVNGLNKVLENAKTFINNP